MKHCFRKNVSFLFLMETLLKLQENLKRQWVIKKWNLEEPSPASLFMYTKMSGYQHFH